VQPLWERKGGSRHRGAERSKGGSRRYGREREAQPADLDLDPSNLHLDPADLCLRLPIVAARGLHHDARASTTSTLLLLATHCLRPGACGLPPQGMSAHPATLVQAPSCGGRRRKGGEGAVDARETTCCFA
jgi:hypothetical protein